MGRKPKVVVPATAPAASPAQTLTDSMRNLVAQAQARAAAGQRLANHESRALRDAWLLDQTKHLWPTMEAAAADLGVSVSSIRGWADEGCPDLEPHSPIIKSTVLAWLLQRAHQRGGQQHANRESLEEIDLRLKRLKAEREEKTLIAEAEDRARQALLATILELREQILRDLPARIAAETRLSADLASAEDLARTLLTDALSDRPLTLPTKESHS